MASAAEILTEVGVRVLILIGDPFNDQVALTGVLPVTVAEILIGLFEL